MTIPASALHDRRKEILTKAEEMMNSTEEGRELIFLETEDDSLMEFFVKLSDAIFKNYVLGRPDLEKYTERTQAEQF